MIGIFIQARINSTRFPSKALKELGGKPSLRHTLLSMKKVQASHYVVLTNQVSYDLISPIAHDCGFDTFVGEDENVLKRFCDCNKTYNVSHIIRGTGDNPLLSYEYANLEIEFLNKNPLADYITVADLPIGTGVELVSAKALEKALSLTKDSFDLEHVCPFIYKNPNIFKSIIITAKKQHAKYKDKRVTMDTEQDYKNLKKIFDKIYKGKTICIDELMEYFEKEDS